MSYQLAYIFITEAEAIAACDLIDTAMGLPISGGVTTHWVTPIEWGEQWAIMYDDTLPVVLGAPVVLPPIPND